MKTLGLGGQALQTTEERRDNRREIIKTLLLVALLGGSLALVKLSPLGYYLTPSNAPLLQARLSQFQAFAPVIYYAGGALIIAMGVPRSVVHILTGMAFGFWGGMLLSTAAALTGSTVIFWLTRLLGRPLFHQKVGRYLTAVDGHIRKNGFWVMVIIRQMPLTSMLTSVLLGLTSIRFGIFILGSIVGLLPEAAIFSLFGSSIRGDFTIKVLIASVFMVAVFPGGEGLC